MPYPRNQLITWLPGNYYHLYNRGARRLIIFKESANYDYVIDKLTHYSERLSISSIAYCLMPNHYHFLVRQDGEHSAGLLPQRIFNAYAKSFNKRFQHSGTIFEGRYKAKHINSHAYLLHLCRYIHANPVRSGLVYQPEDWPFSDYVGWIGRGGNAHDQPAFLKAHFSSASDYQDFVQDYLHDFALSAPELFG
jgi:REP element-mobilizing transposase RayT